MTTDTALRTELRRMESMYLDEREANEARIVENDSLRAENERLRGALDLCVTELSAYGAPRDSMHPHNVAMAAARLALTGGK